MNSKIDGKFNLKKPCKNCPFTPNKADSIYLDAGRREQIIGYLMTQKHTEFTCHKTEETTRSLCAGAIAVCRQRGGDMFAAQLAERVGIIQPGHYDGVVGSDNFELGGVWQS